MITHTGLLQKARRIRLLVLDVDGVLTNGNIVLAQDGSELKFFHVQDGLGMQRVQAIGICIVIISSRESMAVSKRMQELGVSLVYQGCRDKAAVLRQVMQQQRLDQLSVAYVGDDLPDLLVMQHVGLSIAVANAVEEIKSTADWITSKKGGEGAVREVCELIIQSRGVPNDDVEEST